MLRDYALEDESGNTQWAGNIIPGCTRWIERPSYDAETETTTPGGDRPRLALASPAPRDSRRPHSRTSSPRTQTSSRSRRAGC
ncbi:MAG: hypothetical protein MZV65_31745 [Chromatiales bacterium]|nr:hypothetical protein [Chromatiales bacterium]